MPLSKTYSFPNPVSLVERILKLGGDGVGSPERGQRFFSGDKGGAAKGDKDLCPPVGAAGDNFENS